MNEKPFVIWACELCVGGICGDHRCDQGRGCQAWLCTPQREEYSPVNISSYDVKKKPL